MNLTGMVDKRTLEKYEREAKEKSRETWYLSWALDTNQEGEAYADCHITILLSIWWYWETYSHSADQEITPFYGIQMFIIIFT